MDGKVIEISNVQFIEHSNDPFFKLSLTSGRRPPKCSTLNLLRDLDFVLKKRIRQLASYTSPHPSGSPPLSLSKPNQTLTL